MLAAKRTAGNFAGSTLSPARLLKSATDRGNTPTNRPPAMRLTVSCTERLAMLGCGGLSLLARKSSRMRVPGTVLYGGRIQGSFISSDNSTRRRRAHLLLDPATATNG